MKPTQVYAILGYPVGHSRSPAMHNRAFSELGLDAVYVPFEVHPSQLAAAISGLRALNIAGANITLPHKTAVMALLDRVEPRAQAIGAVNTLFWEGDLLCGDNTDAPGLAHSLEEAGVELANTAATIVGAGGAARAAVVGLAQAGAAKITVSARRLDAASALIQSLQNPLQQTRCTLTTCDMGDLSSAFKHTDILVQATSATLGESDAAHTFAASLPLAALPPHATVTDLVYKPLETTVLAAAKARGLKTVDGLGMLLHQGALAFERWTNCKAPIAAMRAALIES